MRDLADVPPHLTGEIAHFFDIYKEMEPGKSTDVRGWQDRLSAEQVIAAARARASRSASDVSPRDPPLSGSAAQLE